LDRHDSSRFLRAARHLAAAALELVYPTRCVGCETGGVLLCDNCLERLPFIDPASACPRCGAPYGRLICTECHTRDGLQDYAFAAAFCALEFRDTAARLVVAYKDQSERRLAALLARLLAAALPLEWRLWANCLAWIPADSRALRRRGFDHMALIGQSLAEQLGLPGVCPLVKLTAADQRKLSRTERFANMATAFALDEPGAAQLASYAQANGAAANLLLIDDVFTTGATLSAAAALLQNHGLAQVRVATLARVW